MGYKKIFSAFLRMNSNSCKNDILLRNMIYGFRRMIYLLRKHDIISVPSYAAGIYHPPKVDIISKIYHPFRQERISLKNDKFLSKLVVFLGPSDRRLCVGNVLTAPSGAQNICLTRDFTVQKRCRAFLPASTEPAAQVRLLFLRKIKTPGSTGGLLYP